MFGILAMLAAAAKFGAWFHPLKLQPTCQTRKEGVDLPSALLFVIRRHGPTPVSTTDRGIAGNRRFLTPAGSVGSRQGFFMRGRFTL